MQFLDQIIERTDNIHAPFIIKGKDSVSLNDVILSKSIGLDDIPNGSVVALIGDFDPKTIKLLINLIDKNIIVVPLTNDTRSLHDYYFENAHVSFVIEGDRITKLKPQSSNPLLEQLKKDNKPGLVLFSTGTTGRPKAILHDFTVFLNRYQQKRKPLKTLNFLLFDHVGGINTLFHTIFNNGEIVIPKERTPTAIAEDIKEHKIELFPTSPSFLRMMLINKVFNKELLGSLKLITYGTEKMDQPTLNRICELIECDVRQTFGMSELGIFQVKTESRDSLWIKIGGDNLETKVIDKVLFIKSPNKMLGYLNAESPFSEDGWYDTGDIVEVRDDWFKVIGRKSQIISVGGLKILPSEIEKVFLEHTAVKDVKIFAKDNPILGQHIEATVDLIDDSNLNKKELKNYLENNLPEYAVPHRIKIGKVSYNHRFKKN